MVKSTFEKEDNNVLCTKIVKACELVRMVENEPRPEILWNGIVKGSTGLIVGIGKTGKTTLAENFALSIAVGRTEFFGYPLSGIRQKVLFVNLEEKHTIRTWRTMEQIKLLSDEELLLFEENYISTPKEFPQFMESDKDWQLLHDYIENSEADICFIDSLSHLVQGEIERSKVFVDFIKKFRQYIGSLNKTVIVIHHNTKGNNEKPMGVHSIAGSRVVTQEFDYAIGLSAVPKRGDVSYLCNIYNKFQRNDETDVKLYSIDEYNWVENLGSADVNDLYDNNITKIDHRIDTTNRDKILQFFIDHKKNLLSTDSMFSTGSLINDIISTKEVQDRFQNKEMQRQTIFDSLKKLAYEGKLIKLGKGKYKLPETVIFE